MGVFSVTQTGVLRPCQGDFYIKTPGVLGLHRLNANPGCQRWVTIKPQSRTAVTRFYYIIIFFRESKYPVYMVRHNTVSVGEHVSVILEKQKTVNYQGYNRMFNKNMFPFTNGGGEIINTAFML